MKAQKPYLTWDNMTKSGSLEFETMVVFLQDWEWVEGMGSATVVHMDGKRRIVSHRRD